MRTLAAIADRKQITDRISALKSSDRKFWGKMNAHQMVCHLCDSHRLALGEKSVGQKSNFFSRTVMKFAALKIPVKWPKNTPTMPEVEQGVGGTAPVDFEQDRAELLSLINRFSSGGIDTSIAHPYFGHMKTDEWLRWGYLHDDHHLRQFGR